MKQWESQQKQKIYQNKILKNKKNSKLSQPLQKVSDYNEYEKQNLQEIPLYKLLKLFKLQQYAKVTFQLQELISRGYGYELDKFKLLNYEAIEILLEEIKVIPGHKIRLMNLIEYIHRNFPDKSYFQTQSNSQSSSVQNSVQKSKSQKINPYTNKYNNFKPQYKKQQTLPKIEQKNNGFQQQNQEQDEFNTVLEQIIEKYQSNKINLESTNFNDFMFLKKQDEDLLMKISQAEFQFKYKNMKISKYDSPEKQIYHQEISKSKKKYCSPERQSFDQEINKQKKETSNQNPEQYQNKYNALKKSKNEVSKLDSTQNSQKLTDQLNSHNNVNQKKASEQNLKEIKTDLDKVNYFIQVKIMYRSFDNAKMTSTLINLDIEELCYCFSFALIVHIMNGDQFSQKKILQLTPSLQQETVSSEESFEDFDESYQKVDQILKESLIIKNNRYNEVSGNNQKNYNDTFDETDPILRIFPKKEALKDFSKNIILTCKMEKEVIIIALIYIQRILDCGYYVTSTNWRLITFLALILASKIWDDESFENENFSKAFDKYTTQQINHFECIYLQCIDYNLFIKCSDYAKYYYILRGFADQNNKSFPLKPLDLQTIIQLQKNSKKCGEIVKLQYINPLNKSYII